MTDTTDLVSQLKRQVQSQVNTETPYPPTSYKDTLRSLRDAGELKNHGSPEVGRQFRQIREALRLSQPDMARVSGLTKSSIYKIEAGKRGISPNTMARFISGVHEYTEKMFPQRKGDLFDSVARLCDTIARAYAGKNGTGPHRGHERFRRERAIEAIETRRLGIVDEDLDR